MILSNLIRGKSAPERFANANPANPANQKDGRGGTLAKLAALALANHREEQTASPLAAVSFSPATQAEIRERHPGAIMSEPFNPTATVQTACDTCSHATARGGCGEPVAAGLSNLEGVIVYHPDKGATCRTWLALIPDDMEALIQRAGTYYEYSTDDWQLIRDTARRDPTGLRQALETALLCHFYANKEST